MKRTFLFCILCQLFAWPLVLNAQKSSTPKTLLWRISGNGLKKDSYLYGTMHLQDKRVFNFSDSLYYYLEKADGYAMEIDLRDFLDSMIQRGVAARESALFDDEDEEATITRPAGKKNATIDSLMKEVKNNNDPASRKKLIRIREALVRMSLKKREEMPTIMDAWFYGIARRQGKWLGSVEDVSDQLSLVDEVGREMNHDALKSSPDEVGRSLEKLIQIYLSRDLDELYRYALPGAGQRQEDRVFVRRNHKMVQSMDSLAPLRSVFFAVGAAHLPGDSGVIQLLRNKGYILSPVLSSKTKNPEQYLAKLDAAPWTAVEDKDKSLWVDMPTTASDINMFGDALSMKYSMDITTMTFFMATSIEVPAGTEKERSNEALNKNKNAVVLNQKEIENGGLKGFQGDVRLYNAYYRVQYLASEGRIYMLMAGGQRREKLNSPDVTRFLKSFKPRQAVAKPAETWYSQLIPDKGVSLEFPRKPRRNKQLEAEMDEDNDSRHLIFDLLDIKADVYMMLRIADLKEAKVVVNDSSYFDIYRKSFAGTIDSITRDEMGTWQGFPVFYLEGYSAERDALLRVMTMSRGNRNYTLYAGGSPEKRSQNMLDRYFQSFRLLPYQTLTRQKQESAEGNFSSTAPAPFRLYQDDEDEETSSQFTHYVSIDSIESVWYEVVKERISKYMWANSDSAGFAGALKGYVSWNDSVLRQQPVVSNGVKGREWIIGMGDSHIQKRIRIFFGGDSIYRLISYIPALYMNEPRHNAFFEDFRITRPEKKIDMLKSKAVLLLRDLQSADSATAAEALEAVGEAPFVAAELPLLYEAYMKQYADDSLDRYYSTRTQLHRAIEKLADKSTLQFVRNNYKSFTGQREPLKVSMLNLLAAIKTKESYALLKELLLKSPPAVVGDRELSSEITDSLQLAATLYPELLQLAANPGFSDRVLQVTIELADSSTIPVSMILPYAPSIYRYTDSLINTLQKTDSADIEGYLQRNRLRLLAKLKQPEAYQLLQKYLSVNQTYVRMEAAILLLKGGQSVAPAALEKIAADKWFRRDLHDSLLVLGKEKLFPEKYLTQALMAESDMYNEAYDEIPVEVLELVGERQLQYKGGLKRFYLFRVQFETVDDEEPEVYLGIAGPFSADRKDVSRINSITGLFTSEGFDPEKLDEHLKAYLDEIASYERDSEEQDD